MVQGYDEFTNKALAVAKVIAAKKMLSISLKNFALKT